MDFKGISDPIVIVGEKPKKSSLFSKIRPPLTNFKANKVFAGALTVLLLFAIGIGVYLSQKPTQLKPQATAVTAEISIKPQNQTVAPNQEFESEVFLDTRDLSVTAIQAVITYDPNFLQLLQIIPGDFLNTTLTAPQITSNSAYFVVANNPGKKGSGKIATLKFKALNATVNGPAKIQFDQELTLGASIETNSENALSGYLASDITISSVASPSPSVTASASPSLSPSLSPSPSPSPKPSASPNNRVTPGSKGDGNSDGLIEFVDLSILFSKWSPAIDITSNFQVDFNDDKKINSFDYSEMNQLLYDLGVIRR